VALSGGYEHIAFRNPSTATPAGSLTIGGYVLAFVNNSAFPKEKDLQVFWGGAKITATPKLDVLFAYYGYKQNSFATGAKAGCSDSSNAACSGRENGLTLAFDYRLSKRFDAYFGSIWTEVQDGLANGFLQKSTVSTTTGIRFKF
jgi:predicted porin